MKTFYDGEIAKSPRIQRLIDHLYENMPVIEANRAVILTESYKATEDEPIIMRRAKAFYAICEKLPIIIRPDELILLLPVDVRCSRNILSPGWRMNLTLSLRDLPIRSIFLKILRRLFTKFSSTGRAKLPVSWLQHI